MGAILSLAASKPQSVDAGLRCCTIIHLSEERADDYRRGSTRLLALGVRYL